MFAEPTINDFRENVRWHLAEAMTRAQGSIAAIKADHASRGILQSGMTYQRIFATVRDEFDAGTRTALGELKRAVRATKLDRKTRRKRSFVQILFEAYRASSSTKTYSPLTNTSPLLLGSLM
jgi:hypothetical protein